MTNYREEGRNEVDQPGLPGEKERHEEVMRGWHPGEKEREAEAYRLSVLTWIWGWQPSLWMWVIGGVLAAVIVIGIMLLLIHAGGPTG